jgi:hypothetical protein
MKSMESSLTCGPKGAIIKTAQATRSGYFQKLGRLRDDTLLIEHLAQRARPKNLGEPFLFGGCLSAKRD